MITSLSVESVWQTFNDPLERFIQRRAPDSQTASDLLQDVYLKIHTHIDTLRDDTRLQSWVYQIARNVIHDYYRNRKPLDQIDEALLVAEPTDDEDETIARLAQSVRAMVDSLPPGYREALLLTEYEGLTQQQLAARMGLSLSGAKSRVQRARKMLREMLLACCHFEYDRLGKVIDYYPRCACCSDGTCQ